MRDTRRAVGALVVVVLAASGLLAGCASSPVTCSDVEVAFARGSTEPQGLGRIGTAFYTAVSGALPGTSVASYDVVYGATADFDVSWGSIDLVDHLEETAENCPDTQFVVAGYSQGALLVTRALGTEFRGAGETTVRDEGAELPDDLVDRTAAVVVFGNPLWQLERTSLDASSTPYGDKLLDYCAGQDLYCGAKGPLPGDHGSYADNGAVADAALTIASRVSSS